MKLAENRKVFATNRKARHEYFIEETYEAGIVLKGTEVKSIRKGKLNLSDAYVEIQNGEAYVNQMHISPYDHGNIFNVDPLRKRKLLLNKRELIKLGQAVEREGYTLIPISAYLSNGKVKIELAICKGKKLYDKRETIAKRDAQRKIERALKGD